MPDGIDKGYRPLDAGRIVARWYGLPLLIGAVWLGLWAAVTGWPGAVIATDINQHRFDGALPIPLPNQPISQTFRPGWNGLNEVEILVARYGDNPAGDGCLTLTLLDDAENEIASQTWLNSSLAHNQSLILAFEPQRDSAGRLYKLLIGGNGTNQFSAWAYTLNVYDQGEVAVPDGGQFQELRFVTRYTLTWPTALAALTSRLSQDGWLIILALAYLFLPGVLLLLIGQRWLPGRIHPIAWWGLALALGLCLWPILWYWLSLFSGRWVNWSLRGTVVGGWLVAFVLYWRSDKRSWRSIPAGDFIFFIAILLAGLAVRLLAIRQLAFPAWVDSGRHALITRLMADGGQTLTNYQPLLAVDRFPYHFGFHTLPAGLEMMTGYSLPELLLILGQLLNGLAPLTIYAAAWLLTRRHRVALIAALLVAFPFFFPAYYATWGRFTQLDGVVVLPVLLAITWLVARSGRGWWLVTILAAGLFFIHFRVFILYLPFAGLVGLFGKRAKLKPFLATGSLALLLIGPRLFTLYQLTHANRLTTSDIGYSAFPFSYLQTGWEPYFWWLAIGGWLTALLAWFVRRRRWALLPLVLMAWMGLLIVLLSGRVPGLPSTWVVNLNSTYITLFVPLSLLLGISSGRAWGWLAQQGWLKQLLAYGGAGAGLAALVLFGSKQQITILNPVTILAEPQDLAAIEWVKENLPQSAKIGVNSWLWLGQTWAGGDGGGWLLTLTGREITTPPADYIYSPALAAQVASFNEQATAISDWATPAAANWLREQGVNYIFVGARGGFFDPAGLSHNPKLQMVYGRDGVFIFALLP